MAKVLSSISGNLISAASAGYAPTNSGDVSAIASAYQVVSATATQLYAGTAHVTSINGDPISASRAGNAANASMATSAYYDGTGRLISSLPDAATVSSIASSYAESAASGKLDKTAQLVSATASDGTYITSINGMGLSGKGDGGAQVVTSTASASAQEGYGPYTTAYLVSSINGSALLPYGFSSVSAYSANWNTTRAIVTANSAKWNSVYNTVNSNSASWSGSTGGGSVTSPNGTIVVTNDNEIEATNSAVLTASGTEYLKTLSPYGNSIGMRPAPLTYSYVDYTGCTLSIALVQDTYQGTTAILSGHDPQGQLATASANILSGLRTIELPMGGIVSAISASANSWLNFNPYDSFTARKSGGIMVTGVGELAWKSAVENVTNTVAVNSAHWGQGGVDSATVSAIASAYQVVSSTASGSGEIFGQTAYYATEINGLTLSAQEAALANYATNAGSAGSAPTNSSEVSAIASSYASGKADSSALSSYALSADVSSTIDTVSSNSATWGQGFQYGNSGSYGVNTIGIGASGAGNKTDAGIYLTSTHGTGFYKVNELTLNRSGYGETVNFNLGSAGSQVRVSASGTRGGYFSAWNDSVDAALVVSGSTPILKLGSETATDSSISNWNECYDTVSANSATWGAGGIDSATCSAIASSYANDVSAAVSGTVDTVSAQSANWGGSALALSAGQGVKLEKVGNTLVAGLDETVLWSGTYQNTATGSIVLSESWKNFQKIEVYGFNSEGNVPIAGIYYTAPFSGGSLMEVVVGTQGFATWGNPATFNVSVSIPCRFTSETAVDIGSAKYVGNWNSNWQAANNLNGRTYISKVVGVNRTAGV